VAIGPFTVVLDGIAPTIGPNWSALEAKLTVRRGDDAPFTMRPQSRFFANPPTTTNEAAIVTEGGGQLYTVIGAEDGGGGRQLRLWWKPLVTLIWLGGLMIAAGGALSLVGRVRREGRVALREAWA
jgi:cytochrome c-type biogenesis protein CcmF